MEDKVTKSPEELASEAAVRKAKKEARDKFLAEISVAVNSAPSDNNVRMLLRYVMALSGFQVNPVAIKQDGDVAINATLYNTGRESVYHDLRKTMSAETRNAVERSE